MRLLLFVICFSLFSQCRREPVHIQRMLYVVPEALPSGYDWHPEDHAVTDVIWVGGRLDKQGELIGAEPALAAMEKHIHPVRKPQGNRQKKKNPHIFDRVRHHLLIGLTDAQAGATILSDAKVRNQSIAEILSFMLRHGKLAGLQLDFEYVSPAHADAFVEYIQLLRMRLGPGIKLKVAVFAPIGMPDAWVAFHKLPELAAESDGIVVMLYDQHRPGTPAGCVSGIAWLNANVDALSTLPVDKVWLGAPLYGYRFGKKTTAISKSRFNTYAAQAVESDGCLKKSTAEGEAYYPASSLYQRFDELASINRFRGIAYWRAGLEK